MTMMFGIQADEYMHSMDSKVQDAEKANKEKYNI
jgi:hypothetical protein